MSLITLNNFSFKYANAERTALDNINTAISEGDFVVICGRSGSGKSTLLRCLKANITPAGNKNGAVTTTLKSEEIAIVFQNPEAQLVNNTVLADLAFHMENLGTDNLSMRKRMAEMVGFFGLEDIIHANPVELSGGQKQLVVLCAAMMTRPKLLLLDEPVSQLDPINAQKTMDILSRLNTELGVTIIMAEHRLDECINCADILICINNGQIRAQGETRQILQDMSKDKLNLFVPDIPRLSSVLTGGEKICLDYKEWRREISMKRVVDLPAPEIDSESNKVILKIRNLFYAYQNTDNHVIKNLNFSLNEGSRICILGGNGSGKSTLLKLIAGILKPTHGIIAAKKLLIGYFPQDVYSYFRFESVLEEIKHDADYDFSSHPLYSELFIDELLSSHPMDLSGGEAAKVVLFCIMLKAPDLILLDEPTRGLDPYAKMQLSKHLSKAQTTVVCATHDLQFASHFATSCDLLFDGSIASSGSARAFFSENDYYTTPINKCIRNICKNAIVFEDVIKLINQE